MSMNNQNITTNDDDSFYKYRGDVVRVIDGDTIIIRVDLGFSISSTISFRLANINTPEIVGIQRADGLAAKQFVMDLLPVGAPVIINTYKDKKGKFGRYLADVYISYNDEWVLLNTLLIEKGHAVLYGK